MQLIIKYLVFIFQIFIIKNELLGSPDIEGEGRPGDRTVKV